MQQAARTVVRAIAMYDDKRAWRYLYKTKRYKKERALFIAANPLCAMCLPRPVRGNNLDHKRAHKGDLVLFWDKENWQNLCDHHHDAIKQAMERSKASEKGLDGWPIEDQLLSTQSNNVNARIVSHARPIKGGAFNVKK